jgi:uncharacterized protein (TIGR00266 family)
MDYEVINKPLPALIVKLGQGEAVECQRGAMSWMTSNISMQTGLGGKGGGLMGALGKMAKSTVTGESIFRNTYTCHNGNGEIAFASTFPGDIICFDTTNKAIVAQKSAYLANSIGVDMSVFFNKKVGAGFFGGEGFIMQKFSGNGTVFLEVDGSAVEYDLAPGETKIVDTGYVVMMDSTVTMDVQMVKGVANVLLGGEGLFNTTLTGPGHITIQTMPISKTAMVLYAQMPHKR